jgi:hypothetical protein
MANTTFLSTSELDFETLKNNLKTFLKGQNQFADYDFDGSNISVLLDILAYNTYLNSFYLNMVGSEMFLDTAQLKESVVSQAKELNYIPRSRASAEALVNITITPSDSPDSIVIPENYAFTTTMDGVTFTFYTDEDHIVIANNGVYQASNVSIFEGKIVTEYFDVTSNTQLNDTNVTLTLQAETIDTRSIKVYVYESNTSTVSYPYTQASSLYGLTGTSNSFFINGYRSNQYQIHFGNGITGRRPSTGNRVKVVYRTTNGVQGNGAYVFNKTSSIQGYSSVSAVNVLSARNGAERESIDAIKFNAPRFFTTQERAVTSQDYINLVMAKFPQFQAVAAYGGEELSPPQYGKVAIALKPYGSTAIVSDALKAQVVAFLNQKNLTTEPIVVDPDILYLVVQSNVKYNTQSTTLGVNTLRTNVKNAIVNFGQTNLDKFGTDLSYSRMLSAIDDVDSSIIGNDTKIKLSKRWVPTPQVTNTISFSFNNELYHEASLYQLPQGHDLVVKTTTFDYVSGNNTYTAYAGDDGLGFLRIYTDVVSGNVTSRVTLNDTAGSVDYYTGQVTLTANVDSYSGSHISITAELLGKDVTIRRNEFLVISAQDVSVTMVPVTE